jgi:hypothetical protein
VEADQFGTGITIEMAPDSITYTVPKCGNRIGLGVYGDAHSLRRVTPFGCVFDDKNDLAHTGILPGE